jgi:transposase-like protein
MMAERRVEVTHTTILRLQRFVPEFEKRWSQYARPVGRSWRCERRDVEAAKRFFSKAMKQHGTPRVITLDAYAASHRAITNCNQPEQ